ncbi:hypothetical protein BGZ96_011909 [Linnemannia gamsii]|uniref:Uncharacterized protein n=1 Tax=Linnemannia gamsii TaxID=64522 RepID=A0ABQ7JRC2_9FUNG|nr:hypothetical protein BGZ96_011909 [Linnemannia gamsii]
MKSAPSTSLVIMLIALSMALFALLVITNTPATHAAPVTNAAAPAMNSFQAADLQNPKVPIKRRYPLLTHRRASTGDERKDELRWVRLPEGYPMPERRKRELRNGDIKKHSGWVEEWSGTP